MNDLEPFAHFELYEGEDHVPLLLLNEKQSSGSDTALLATDTRVPGRLLGRHAVYEDIGAHEYIVESIKNGYKLEFDEIPPQSFTRNNRSARVKPDFVWEELLRLEKLGCISRSREKPHIVLPLSCVYSNKWRLVVDASRTLNPFCTKRKIKLEDLSHVGHTIRPGDYMVCNDLDSGYWHVPIHAEHKKFLGSHFVKEDGETIYWVWNVLCLGLRDAAYIFTKLLAPLFAQLRSEGWRGLVYIDDVWTLGSTFEDCIFWERRMKELLHEAGWVFKPSKRSGPPSRICKFLGLVINSSDLTFNIPEDKIRKIVSKAVEIKFLNFVKVRKLASFVGLLQSVRLATGPIVSIFTRSLYRSIKEARSWESFVKLDAEASFETQWWIENIRSVSTYKISRDEIFHSIQSSVEMASDASGVGHFVYKLDDHSVLCTRAFTEWEKSCSSTHRELLAFCDLWDNFENCVKFRNSIITHYTDSKAMVFIIGGGSRNPQLQRMIRKTILNLRSHNIRIDPVWISRESEIITYADAGSRDFHSDDIEVDYETFQEAQQRFGRFEIDCFASNRNAKCEYFFSKLDSPSTSGINFFSQTLKKDVNYWIFPPVRDLCRAIWHLKNQECSGVLLLPVWPRSSFFSFFFPDGNHLADWVIDVMWTRPFFICGPQVESKAFRGRKSFDTIIIKVDFNTNVDFYKPVLSKKYCRSGGCDKCT